MKLVSQGLISKAGRWLAVTLLAGASASLAVDTAKAGGGSYEAPVVNWGGVYIGGQVGAVSSDIDTRFIAGTGFGVTADDGIWGGHLGYQRQVANIVLGVETGIFATFNDKSGSISCPDPQFVCQGNLKDALFTVGGRLGFAFEHLMPYITLGYAHGTFGYTADGPRREIGTTDHHGVYAGAGLDWMVRDNWILGIEYRGYRFADATNTPVIVSPANLAGQPGNRYTQEPTSDTFTFRVSYKFGRAPEHYEPLK